jgi:cupin fold WbuC family metalloprotein
MQYVIEETPEVYYASTPVAVAGDEEIAFLKARSAENPRMRCRLCLHGAPSALQHEMLIVHHRTSYVRPHRHASKSETLTVIEGEAIAFTFDDSGTVIAALPLGAPGSGRSFTYFMPAGVWHSLVITSEWLVFLETAAGPFDRNATAFPVWAPDGSDAAAAASYAGGITTGRIPVA